MVFENEKNISQISQNYRLDTTRVFVVSFLDEHHLGNQNNFFFRLEVDQYSQLLIVKFNKSELQHEVKQTHSTSNWSCHFPQPHIGLGLPFTRGNIQVTERLGTEWPVKSTWRWGVLSERFGILHVRNQKNGP